MNSLLVLKLPHQQGDFIITQLVNEAMLKQILAVSKLSVFQHYAVIQVAIISYWFVIHFQNRLLQFINHTPTELRVEKKSI
jgi:hypothetical protein